MRNFFCSHESSSSYSPKQFGFAKLTHTIVSFSSSNTLWVRRWTIVLLSLSSPLDIITPSPLFIHPSIPLYSSLIIICGARRRPLVSLGCFPDSRGCAWWWPLRLGTAAWCGLWAGWHSWKAPSRPGGHRPFVERRWCCQSESRMKSAGSWCQGDHWMRLCEEGWWVGKDNRSAIWLCYKSIFIYHPSLQTEETT